MSDTKGARWIPLAVKLDPELLEAFKAKCLKYGDRVTDIHREIITAFVEDRLTIKPNPKKESLYDS